MGRRKWYYLMPLVGTIFGIWYIHIAFYDVVYSDYIRLVNSYLPDVWNPSHFFVPDILTRVPLTFLGRIVNTTFFHYSVTFDQILGVCGTGLVGVVLVAYCNWRRLGLGWTLAVMVLVFSLNKWEMLTNGSGWVHFYAFAGFFYHYLVLDRVWSGEAKPHDRGKLLGLPWVMILGVAGQYCAAYAAVLFLAYLFKIVTARLSEKRWSKEYGGYFLSTAAAFGCYLLSNAFAVEDHAGMHDVSLVSQLLDTPSYFVRFLLKSLASMVAGSDYARSHFTSEAPYMVLGILVAAAYLMALLFQYRYRIYERTILPLILIVTGGANHLLVLLSRWKFLIEDYGMGSRYALQYAAGALGIVLTCSMVWKAENASKDRGNMATDGGKKAAPGGKLQPPVHGENRGNPRRILVRGVTFLMTALFLVGAVGDTRQELHTAPYRRQLCVERAKIAIDFENRTDDELRENFEYRTSRPESGRAVREALTILKEQGWNVFDQGRETLADE